MTNQPGLGYISNYALIERLDEDGPIIRYHAKNKTGEDRIVKQLRMKSAPNSLGMVNTTSSDKKKAFKREAKLLESLDHPNIVKFFDFWESEADGSVLVTQFPGPTLLSMVSKYGAFTLDDTLKVGVQICEVLQFLHVRISPIVSGNVRPAAISITREGNAVLIDLSNTRMYIKTAPDAPKVNSEYASPEQTVGRHDFRTDIYSLGATLRYMRTGSGPHAAPKSTGMESLDQVLELLTQQNPDERPQDIKAARRMLYTVYQELVPNLKLPKDL